MLIFVSVKVSRNSQSRMIRIVSISSRSPPSLPYNQSFVALNLHIVKANCHSFSAYTLFYPCLNNRPLRESRPLFPNTGLRFYPPPHLLSYLLQDQAMSILLSPPPRLVRVRLSLELIRAVSTEHLADISGQGGVSLPPLHTAVPLAKLDTYRRAKDTSVSPIQEMLFRKSSMFAQSHKTLPSSSFDRKRMESAPHNFPSRSHTDTVGRPILSRLTTDLYPDSATLSNLKSPRKRGMPGCPYSSDNLEVF